MMVSGIGRGVCACTDATLLQKPSVGGGVRGEDKHSAIRFVRPVFAGRID